MTRFTSSHARSSSSAESSSLPTDICKTSRTRHTASARAQQPSAAVVAAVEQLAPVGPDHNRTSGPASGTTTAASVTSDTHSARSPAVPTLPEPSAFAHIDADLRERFVALSAQIVVLSLAPSTDASAAASGALINSLVDQLARAADELTRRQLHRCQSVHTVICAAAAMMHAAKVPPTDIADPAVRAADDL